MFDLAALEAELAGTLFAGKLHFSCVTGSTNADAVAAARLARRTARCISADEQLAGRGRGDHGWISAAGEGLYVSVLLRPQIPAARLRFSASRRGPGCRRCHPRCLFARPRPRFGNRPPLAQRSPHRPAQDRRHSRRGKYRLQESAPRSGALRCSGHWHQRASARVSAGPGHARHVTRSGNEPAHRAPNPARSPC